MCAPYLLYVFSSTMGLAPSSTMTPTMTMTMTSSSTASSNGTVVSAVTLGAAANYAILAGSTVTNTGNSIVNGDVGINPGTAATGFYPPGVINGEIEGEL